MLMQFNSIDDSIINLQIFIYQLRKFEEAIKAYDKALNLNPNHYLAWYYKGIEFYL